MPCGGRKSWSPPLPPPRNTLEASLRSLLAIQLNYQLLLQLEPHSRRGIPCVLLFLPTASLVTALMMWEKRQALCEKESEFGCKEKLWFPGVNVAGGSGWFRVVGAWTPTFFWWLLGKRYLCTCNEGLGKNKQRICSEDRGVTSEGFRHSFKSQKLNLNGTVSTVIIYCPKLFYGAGLGFSRGSAPTEDCYPVFCWQRVKQDFFVCFT